MKEEAYILEKELPVQSLLGVFANLDLVLGMRLHSLIFAAASGVPAVGICYDPKVEGFLKQVGQINAGNVECIDYNTLKKAVFDAALNPEPLREKLKDRVHQLRRRAWDNAELAVKIARGKQTVT